jgi:REP-associated tyrosine transposase
MARQLRIQYEGAIYHLTSRGDRREDIFRDHLDRKSFLATLGAACQKSGWQVHAYCLMSNHFHLVVETPRANLVEGMKWLLGTYTMRFNRRHKLSGHLFAGRYKSLLQSIVFGVDLAGWEKQPHRGETFIANALKHQRAP